MMVVRQVLRALVWLDDTAEESTTKGKRSDMPRGIYREVGAQVVLARQMKEVDGA